MTKVIFDISTFLDGFVTASNVRPEEPLGDGGQRLHRWACLRRLPTTCPTSHPSRPWMAEGQR
jgi:hypothetical protein